MKRTNAEAVVKCPGFYSPQAGCHLRCDNVIDPDADLCTECRTHLKHHAEHERSMDALDQFGSAA